MPPWARFYTLLIWPVLWSVTKEMPYLGYLLPRLETLTGSTVLAVATVLGFWTLQHTALPLILDGRYLFYRSITAFVTVAIQTALILRHRRLLPLILTHYLADLSPGVAAVLMAP